MSGVGNRKGSIAQCGSQAKTGPLGSLAASAHAATARESTLTWKANEFTNDVKARGSALLSALEKKLRQGQEIALLQAIRAVKQKQIDDVNVVVAASKKTKI
jgi:hypothetical protein